MMLGIRRLRRWVPVAGIVLLLPLAADAAKPTATLGPAECDALIGLSIPATAIGLPTGGAVVEAAKRVAASTPDNHDGSYCKVTGVIHPHHHGSPNMEFEVNLPRTWNGRALQFGGGGYDGTLVTGLGPFTLQPAKVENPLKQGFVTLGSDGGHEGGPGFDGSFGLDDEALLNFGKESVKKTHDVAVAIIRKAYGHVPRRFYFIGGSQGGHEALDAAARYPDDYDGVVANFPAYNVTLLHLGSWNVGKALYANDGAGWIDPGKTRLIVNAVYATCDGLDGVKDGIISNVKACDAAFRIETLRCPNGTDLGDRCLSDAEIRAAKQIASPYQPGFAIAGMDTFPKWPLFEGAKFKVSNFGSVRQPSNPLSGKEALLYMAGDQTIKFIITRDPSFNTLQFQPQKWRARIKQVASIMDVTNVSLAKFKAKGGKVILTHGMADTFITPWNTVAYYERQLKDFGQAGVDEFIRFYLIPGLSHGFGTFDAKFNSLKVLEDWVERGDAPQALVVTDGNPGAHRSRPLCEYPSWPKFTGARGTEDQASSFTCTLSSAGNE